VFALVAVPAGAPPAAVTVPGDGGFGGVGVPLPPVIVAVSSVSVELLVQVIGTLVLPMAIVNASGLPLVN